MKRTHIVLASIAAAALLLSSTYFFVFDAGSAKQVLTVFCATSLQYPFHQVEEDFENTYPNVDVHIEAHGTIQVIRHVTELNYKVDLVFVADYSLIPRMMYTTKIPETGQNYADYYIRFATNTLVLAYTNNSNYANEINQNNWDDVLSRQNVRLGYANPQLDALGYRALMAIQLAENYYDKPHFFHDLITANLNPPISSVPDGTNFTILVPETQNPVGDKLTMRASEVDLISLLQTGYLDYCFLYLSNAKQYGFNYIELADEINLGSDVYSSTYEKIQVKYDHQRFSTVSLDRQGETIYYGLTIPNNAPNPELAQTFIKFLLAGQGKTDFENQFHPILNPSYSDNIDAVPNSLRSLAIREP
jgi:molybdate/tungstate transport system substrate-binding protein